MAPFTSRFNRTVGHLRRYRHIAGVLMKYGLDELSGRLTHAVRLRLGKKTAPEPAQQKPDRRSRPQRVRLALQELGPTFVKLGQLLSTRPDLLPLEYVEELQKLQDQVAAVPFEAIRERVEAELGGKLEDLFETFDPEPLAAGSIAQVHRARITDGQEVVVKVRRPNIVETIRTECEILEDLAGLVQSTLTRNETIEPVRIVREFTQTVSKEVSLSQELRNLKRFARFFASSGEVRIPRPFEDYCTDGVLTMEDVTGVKPSSAEVLRQAGLDPKLIARRGARFILQQIFVLGMFHSDPHPGNLFVLPGNVIALLDFGQAAQLSRADQRWLGEILLAVADEDSERLVRAIQRAEMVQEDTDLESLSRAMEEMLRTYYDMPLKEIPFRQMMRRTFELIRKYRVRPPAQFTMMLKSMMTTETLATTLDPDFQILDYIKPYAWRIGMEQFDPRRLWTQFRRAMRDAGDLAVQLPEDLAGIITKFKRGQFQMHIQHEHLEQLVRTMDKSSNRISFGLIIAGLLVGSSQLVTQEGEVLRLVSYQTLGILGYIIAAVLGIWLLISIIRSRDI